MAELTAGAAKASITPAENLNLGAHSRTDQFMLMRFKPGKATGVHDDIYARCLALSDGQTLLAMTALDLLGFFRDDIEQVRARAREKTGREDLQLLVGSTHNHCAPDTYGMYGGVPQSYKRLIYERASDAVAAAVGAMAPARIGFATARVTGVAGNRWRPDGAVDEEASIMAVDTPEGKSIATLVNFPCHADIVGPKNMLVSADFPGYMCRDLEEARGGTAVFFNGALADIYPLQTIEDRQEEKGLRTYEEAEKVGTTIARAVLEALKGAEGKADARIGLERKILDLPATNKTLYLANLLGYLGRKRKLYGGFLFYNRRARTESWAIAIDGAQIRTIPGQTFCKVGLELKQGMSAPHRFVFGLTNDEVAYITPPEEWDPARSNEEEQVATLGKGTWPALKAALPPMPPAGSS